MTEQWKLEGNCKDCRRQEYCNKNCTAKKKKDQEIIKNIVGQAFDPINVIGKGPY